MNFGFTEEENQADWNENDRFTTNEIFQKDFRFRSYATSYSECVVKAELQE